MCMCVCVCVCERGRERERGQHGISSEWSNLTSDSDVS